MAAFMLYGVGWLARISAWGLGFHHKNADLGDAVTLVSSFLMPLSVFATLSFIVLVWERFTWAKENRSANPFSVVVIALIILEMAAGMAEGSRSQIIIPLIYTAFAYNYTIKRLGWRHVIVGTVVLVTILAPITTIYRSAYYDKLDERGASLSEATRVAGNLVDAGGQKQYGGEVVNVALRLSSQLKGALVVYDNVPEKVDYALGGTFFPSALTNFIPRLFWPDKPIVIPGREFAEKFWGVSIGEKYATNIGISWIGEAYYNFGWFGLVIPLATWSES